MTTCQEVVTEIRPAGGVVVGDDGSPAAGAALQYALGEARRRNTDLHVIRAWRIPTALSMTAPMGYVPALSELETAMREDLQDRVDRILGDPEDVKLQSTRSTHPQHAPSSSRPNPLMSWWWAPVALADSPRSSSAPWPNSARDTACPQSSSYAQSRTVHQEKASGQPRVSGVTERHEEALGTGRHDDPRRAPSRSRRRSRTSLPGWPATV